MRNAPAPNHFAVTGKSENSAQVRGLG